MTLLRSMMPLALAIMTSACAQADPVYNPLAQAWSSGKSVVVTIDAIPDNTSEAYGDFAYYLNGFSASVDDNWAFFNQDTRHPQSKLPITVNVEAPPYSVLFMKDNKGYLYPGPILEPQVYDVVRRIFEGQDIPDYLYQFMPDEVAVEAAANGEEFLINRETP